jgi:hypothetical protein
MNLKDNARARAKREQASLKKQKTRTKKGDGARLTEVKLQLRIAMEPCDLGALTPSTSVINACTGDSERGWSRSSCSCALRWSAATSVRSPCVSVK